MKKYFLILFVFAALASCNKDDSNKDCVEFEIAYVTNVEAPEIGTVGETLEIEVSFDVYNSCGDFDDFIQQQENNTRIIEIKVKYEGCICLQAISTITERYSFKPSAPGNFEFKFKSAEDEYITVIIAIS